MKNNDTEMESFLSAGDHLVSFAGAAQMLGGVSVRTIRRMTDKGELPKPVKVGRCSRLFQSDILAYMDRLKKARGDGSGNN